MGTWELWKRGLQDRLPRRRARRNLSSRPNGGADRASDASRRGIARRRSRRRGCRLASGRRISCANAKARNKQHSCQREAYLPDRLSIKSLREASARCKGCDLYRYATQTVFGEGAARARLMFVGEQPGNEEDLSGHPFVGPSGRLLRKAMQDAGIRPRDAYITNAVKHFEIIERGKRRIHAKPKVTEIRACEPWLEAEIAVVRPQARGCAARRRLQVLLGPAFRLDQASSGTDADAMGPSRRDRPSVVDLASARFGIAGSRARRFRRRFAILSGQRRRVARPWRARASASALR